MFLIELSIFRSNLTLECADNWIPSGSCPGYNEDTTRCRPISAGWCIIAYRAHLLSIVTAQATNDRLISRQIMAISCRGVRNNGSAHDAQETPGNKSDCARGVRVISSAGRHVSSSYGYLVSAYLLWTVEPRCISVQQQPMFITAPAHCCKRRCIAFIVKLTVTQTRTDCLSVQISKKPIIRNKSLMTTNF